MIKEKSLLKDISVTTASLCVAFGVSLILVKMFDLHTTIPAIFTLAVFLISRYTERYIYGVIGSLLSMLAVNFAFTFPYFRFNFIIVENLVSAIVMLIISIMTGVLTTELKKQEKIRVETEKEKMRTVRFDFISLRTAMSLKKAVPAILSRPTRSSTISKPEMKFPGITSPHPSIPQ